MKKQAILYGVVGLVVGTIIAGATDTLAVNNNKVRP
jgi:hypothetical protein